MLVYIMQNLQDLFFSPLGKEWCLYYFILLVFSLIALVITVITSIMSIFSAKKLTVNGFFKNTIVPILSSLIIYFLSRLAYSICVGALH